jgi:bacillithiol biosynthesis deacetylase BshB1
MKIIELDVLAIGAHPDDIELSCGGTIAMCVKQGYKVGILDLTRGELGTRGTPKTRAEEAANAASILGVIMRENLGLPDGNIEVNEKNRLKLISVYRKYRPKILLMPHWLERHPDHEHANTLAREAWFYSGLRKKETKINGKIQEPWRPERYFHFMQTYEFTPSFIVDISSTYDTRLKAMMTYKSQFYNPASKEPATFLSNEAFLKMLETRAKYFGSQISAKYGEPFFSVEPIGITDLFALPKFKA